MKYHLNDDDDLHRPPLAPPLVVPLSLSLSSRPRADFVIISCCFTSANTCSNCERAGDLNCVSFFAGEFLNGIDEILQTDVKFPTEWGRDKAHAKVSVMMMMTTTRLEIRRFDVCVCVCVFERGPLNHLGGVYM